MLRIIFVILSCFGGASIASHPDEIKDLPGLDTSVNFKHYSGYLNATRGRYLHYWFAESQRSPSTDPVVLWLNGGPGCSSLYGFLRELGPLHISADGKSLYKNPYSWNRVANVIFLEAPAGVGFSYADNKKYSTDDDSVSYDNYVALQNFFEKFPEFKKNDFYITGESYGGIYVPTLSVRVLTGPANINFKGFAVGNGYLDGRNMSNSLVFFTYSHGLIGDKLWSRLSTYCCGGAAAIETCNFHDSSSLKCQNAVNEVSDVVLKSGLNIYNLYSDCAYSQERNSRYLVDKRNMFRHLPKPINGYRKSHDPACLDSSNVRKWINQPSVREALHIPSHVQDWGMCSSDVGAGYNKIYETMRPQVLQLLHSGLRGLIYNGDTDMSCNFLGDKWFASNLGLPVTKEYGSWTYDNQVAGFSISYGPLTFVTVKREKHLRGGLSPKLNKIPPWVFTRFWADEAHFSLYGDVNTNNCRIWASSDPRVFTEEQLYSLKLTVWCEFTGFFIIGPLFFKTHCPIWHQQTFGYGGYLKSRVYRSRPYNLSELKDAIRRELSCIKPDIPDSAVAGFVTCLQSVITCGGGHVEHMLL
ncbi:unnamed protein product [Larinioides sclopetarius]|uniref:Carboxypeptidase n=1 Tax=Larinioides sclopetarius TaxID=280406 RepID=A0AAV1YWV8_9ARAC